MQTTATAEQIELHSYAPCQMSHSHAFHQIILPLYGTLELETEIGCGFVGERAFAVVTAGREHAYRAAGDNRFLTFNVQDEAFEATEAQALWEAAARRLLFPIDERLGGLLAFARGCGDAAFATTPFRSALATLVLHGLGPEQLDLEPAALSRAKSFVERHLADAISVEDIAEAAHVSIATLNRLFRTHEGIAPAKYLSRLRLDRARHLLATARLPIAQVALSCGYSEQSALSRALRREDGLSPKAYREHMRLS